MNTSSVPEPPESPPQPPPPASRWPEVLALFLHLGLTAYGGPAAHIGLMHTEIVKRRRWLDDQQFLDLLGATNLIPGPNSTEMAIHIGFLRAGWPGLIAGGIGFIFPATLIVMFLAWLYVQYGTRAEAGWLLYGIKPVVIAIIVQALWQLGKKALRDALTALAAAVALVLFFININEILLLVLCGVAVMVIYNLRRGNPPTLPALWLPLAGLGPLAAAAVPFSLPILFLTFLKIGSVLYGGGYVLLAFVQADFVERLGWLTQQQLLDAVAVGQVTPGPLFTTATFIGYTLGGVPGALLATLGIFLPSFIFVAISNPIIPRLRSSPWAAGMLDGVNAASLGLMAAVTIEIGRASLVDLPSLVVTLVSAVLLFRYKINSTWLILGGAIWGIASALLVP